MSMPVRRGIHEPLESAANAILKEALAGETSRTAKSDILTEWKEQDRRSREIYVSSGVPDPAIRQGMFHRVLNPRRPELNSRDGIARPRGPELLEGGANLGDFLARSGGAFVPAEAAWDDYA